MEVRSRPPLGELASSLDEGFVSQRELRSRSVLCQNHIILRDKTPPVDLHGGEVLVGDISPPELGVIRGNNVPEKSQSSSSVAPDLEGLVRTVVTGCGQGCPSFHNQVAFALDIDGSQGPVVADGHRPPIEKQGFAERTRHQLRIPVFGHIPHAVLRDPVDLYRILVR